MRQNKYPIQTISFTKVQIIDKFWAPRIETNRKVTIPLAFKKCEETGRIKNFSKAAGLIDDDIVPFFPFDDSDVYKIIEGAAYSLKMRPDSELEKYVDDIIEKIAAAQEKDGYLYTTRTINPIKPHYLAGKKRWEWVSLQSHELYNLGHLIESAVAYHKATGKRNLLDVAIKSADLIGKVFGQGKNESAPGHQEIEMALVSLYHVTENEKYLKLAKFFLDIRGSKDAAGYDDYVKLAKSQFVKWGDKYLQYNQTHKKVIEQDEAVGHAVRATYMYSGMVDIAALTSNKNYIEAIDRIWENVVSKKIYITGGIGAKAHGEAFDRNYKLPNLKAYNETCAAIGNIFWNHRLFLLHGDSKYIDVMERTLYNGFLSGISLDGKKFFYSNPLASSGYHERSEWFKCACCPSNIVRFIASIPGYVYAQHDDTLYINLFVSNTTTISLAENIVSITQDTEYPWDGLVKMTINLQKETDFNIAVRIPGWTQNKPVPSNLYRYLKKSDVQVSLKVNGKPFEIICEKGYTHISRTWKDGDIIELDFPMTIRRVSVHEKVKEDNGKVAFERGPIVYCVEWVDNKAKYLRNLFIDDDLELASEYREDMLNGIVIITGTAHYLKHTKDRKEIMKNKQNFLSIPYYAWAHRGKGEMIVWMLRDLKGFK